MDIKLNTEPARPLTSREIAKVLAGVLGTLAGWCDPADIETAMNHFYTHAEAYRKQWRMTHALSASPPK